MGKRTRQWLAAGLVVLAVGAFVVPRAAGAGEEDRRVGRDAGAPEDRRVGEDASSTWGWIRTIVALAVVVALIFALRWLLRRWGSGRTYGGATGPIDVLARASLSSRHHLFLVRLGERLVLVGSSPQGLATLAEVTDPQEVARLAEAAERARPAGLAHLLRGLSKRAEKEADKTEGDSQRKPNE